METRIRQLRKAGLIALVTLPMLLLVWQLVLPTEAAAAKIKSPGTWTAPCGTPGGLACMLEGREGAATTVVDNEIIVSHGFSAIPGDTNDTRIYDIDADTWSNPAPVPPACVRSELAGAAHGDLHYAVGGRGFCGGGPFGVLGDLEVYDRVANAWSTLPSMPTPRAGLAAAVVGNKLYAIGGRTGTTPGTGAALSCLEAYEIALAIWSPACGTPGALAPMPVAAMDVAAIAHGGKIYVIGGASGPDFFIGAPLLSTVQIYDVAHDSWAPGAAMPTARANLALAKCGSVILALGGRTGPAFLGAVSNTATVEAYDIPS